MPHNFCYEFGPYHLNLGRRVLMYGGETISLTPKATEILVILVTNAGQLVEKDELLKQVWPDSAGRALLLMLDELIDCLDQTEKIWATEKLQRLFGNTQQTGLQARVKKCIDQVQR